MAITPTVLIAAQGMMSGQGIGVNADQTAQLSSVTSSGIAGSYTSLNAVANTVPGLSTTLASLPSAITGLGAAASAASAQAAKMAPDVKTFITAQSSAASFGAASAEYSAALAEFGNKSFGDLGVGVKNLVDANSGGLTAALPGLGALAAKAKNDAFGGLSASLDPTALAKGAASVAGNSIKDGLDQVAGGLKNFGSLLDFKMPGAFTYTGLYVSLQQQGLAASIGIDDAVKAAGFDPKSPTSVPGEVLKNIYSGITGNDLQKVISQTGVKTVIEPRSLLDLTDPSYIMSAGATAALGIKSGSGIAGLSSLGNTLTNLGVPLDAASAASLMNAAQTKVGPYLSSLTELVPTSVKTALGPMLGTGSGLFGNPTMKDMMGSVSGEHTDMFASVAKTLGSITTSPIGQSLNSAMAALQAAIASGSGISTALTALQNATTAFNAQASTNSDLKNALSGAAGKLTDSANHLAMEVSNLSLGGLDLNAIPSSGGGMTQIMGFASKLHGFGVDKQMLGHSKVLEGVATQGLTGDAIKAALAEGKNIAKAQALGMPTPTVANEKSAMAGAASSQLDDTIAEYQAAKSDEKSAYAAALSAKQLQAKLGQESLDNPADAGLQTQYQTAKADTQAKLAAWNSALEKSLSLRSKVYDMGNASGNLKDLEKAVNATKA